MRTTQFGALLSATTLAAATLLGGAGIAGAQSLGSLSLGSLGGSPSEPEVPDLVLTIDNVEPILSNEPEAPEAAAAEDNGDATELTSYTVTGTLAAGDGVEPANCAVTVGTATETLTAAEAYADTDAVPTFPGLATDDNVEFDTETNTATWEVALNDLSADITDLGAYAVCDDGEETDALVAFAYAPVTPDTPVGSVEGLIGSLDFGGSLAPLYAS